VPKERLNVWDFSSSSPASPEKIVQNFYFLHSLGSCRSTGGQYSGAEGGLSLAELWFFGLMNDEFVVDI